MQEDKELLRDYVRDRSEPAFAELVRRHIDLVFSAASRETRGDAAAAEDVTQAVFMELARKAPNLERHPAIAGWLYTCVRRVSGNLRRSNERRQRREREAFAINAVNLPDSTESAWREIEPCLDDAMHELSEADRAAVVLRYFENRNHRDVGAALGISETAARKRVDRALETLRSLLLRRGVTTSGALSTVLSANAVQTAPLNLALSISASAAVAGVAVPTTMTMIAIQKVLITAALAAGIGVAFHEAHEASRLRTLLQTQQQQAASVVDQLKRLRMENDAVSNRLALAGDNSGSPLSNSELLKLRAENTRLHKAADLAAADNAKLQEFQDTVLDTFSNTPPIKTLLTRTTADVNWNQTIVTGGWKTPSGKRAILLSTPQCVDAAGNVDINGKQVHIQSKLLEYPDDAGAQLGLARFNVDGQDANEAHVLSSAEVEALLKAIKQTGGVEIVTSPQVVVLDGREAELKAVNIHSIPSGEQYSTGPVLDYLPTISEDHKSVRLAINTRINYSLYPAPDKH